MDETKLPILCMLCDQTLKGDQAYIKHMESVHGSSSPDKALQTEVAIKKNTPPQTVTLSKDQAPSPEFAELARLIDEPPPPPPTVQEATPVSTPPPTKAPALKLKYKYEGTCPVHGVPVETIVIEALGQLTANAYCLPCHEVLEQIKVHPIEAPVSLPPSKGSFHTLQEPIKERRGHGKRHKPKLLSQDALQDKVSTSRLPESGSASLQS